MDTNEVVAVSETVEVKVEAKPKKAKVAKAKAATAVRFLLNATLARGWKSWLERMEAAREKQSVGNRVLQHWCSSSTSLAFRRWTALLAETKELKAKAAFLCLSKLS